MLSNKNSKELNGEIINPDIVIEKTSVRLITVGTMMEYMNIHVETL